MFFRYSITSVSAGRSHSAVIDGKHVANISAVMITITITVTIMIMITIMDLYSAFLRKVQMRFTMKVKG